MSSISSDLRAPSLTKKRARARAQKYYSFRGVNSGQLGQPHRCLLDQNGNSNLRPPLPKDAPLEYWTKRRMFLEAQQYPRPPAYHHAHVDKLHKCGMTAAYGRRRQTKKDVGKMVREVVENGEQWIGVEPRCLQPCAFCDAEGEWEDRQEREYEDAAWDEECAVSDALAGRETARGAGYWAGKIAVDEQELDGWEDVEDASTGVEASDDGYVLVE